MKIADHEILRERGHWVEEGRLYSPLLYEPIMKRLEHLIANPDYPAYSLRNDVKRTKRIRIGEFRIFVNMYPQVLAILGVVVKGAITSDEKSGTIDNRFLHYLQSHQEFIPYRFIPIQSFKEYTAAQAFTAPAVDYFVPAPTEPAPEPPLQWGPLITAQPLTEAEASRLLLNDITPMSRIEANMIDLIQRAMPGERVLVPFPPGSEEWEKWQIRHLQSSIKQRLAVIGRNYSVRFDEFSRKFMLIPPDKIETYAWTRMGRLPKTVQEVQNVQQ